jgi:hypothetical protein
MTDFSTFMDRSVGSWVSYRRYLFGEKRASGEYTTNFDIESTGDLSYKITWVGKTEGEMDVVVDGDELKRSRSYFGPDDDSTYQKMYWVDADTVVFRTAYDGTSYREEIRFLDDNTRLRQTVGRDEETREITLVGQYAEFRSNG